MQLTDLSFGKCHDTNAGKAHQLEEGGDMFLISTDAIERLGKHNVELAFASILKKLLIARAEMARARHAAICIGRDQRPFFANDPLSANEELILDRCRALEVGRIAGIYAHAHDGSPRSRCLMGPLLRR